MYISLMCWSGINYLSKTFSRRDSSFLISFCATSLKLHQFETEKSRGFTMITKKQPTRYTYPSH
jgi:hypothetical protein